MKQRSVGEYAIEGLVRHTETQKVLAPDFTAAMAASHFDKTLGALQSHCDMAKFRKNLEVPAWSAAKIQYPARRFSLDMPQQRSNILSDIVVFRALPEGLRTLVVASHCKL